MPPGRNDIQLWTYLDGAMVSHFRLREFENAEGLAMIHVSVLESLEKVRRDLIAEHQEEVQILITDAVRTRADLDQLAQRLGWTDEGGQVARNSRHLTAFGGIAVDLVAVFASSKKRLPLPTVAAACRRHFDYVQADYPDGHVHADNRLRGVH